MDIKEIISSGLLELYILGIASNEQKSQVESWITKYPEVSAEIMAIEKSMETYAVAYGVEPAPSVKDDLFTEISKGNKAEISNKILSQNSGSLITMSSWLKWVAAASVILLIGSTIFNVVMFQKYNNEKLAKAEIESKLSKQSEEYATLTDQWQVVQSKYSEPVMLQGLEAAPDAAAKIFWMKNTGEVYIDPTFLPIAPDGQQYQLWGIVNGVPVDGGMINMDTKGKIRIQKMKSFGKAEAFAITLEQSGGSPTPKGKMFVMGKI